MLKVGLTVGLLGLVAVAACSSSPTQGDGTDSVGSTSSALTSSAITNNNSGGRCFSVVGNYTSPGTRTQLWDCASAAGQSWAFTDNGTLVAYNGSMCLDTSGGGVGSAVVVNNCSNSYNQTWERNDDGTISHKSSGLCVGTNGGTGNGSLLTLQLCAGQADQKWTSSVGNAVTTCTDYQPSGGYTCAQQASWGKCGQSFMAGYCNASCGRCNAGGAAFVPNCPTARPLLSPTTYTVSTSKGPEPKYDWGNVYFACPNSDLPADFGPSAFEQGLASAGCTHKTNVGPDTSSGRDCRASWYIALCPNNSTVSNLVNKYHYTEYLYSNSYAPNCNKTYQVNGSTYNLLDTNPLNTSGQIIVGWDPSDDGSQPQVNAAGTSNPAQIASVGRAKCLDVNNNLITDGRTCMLSTAQYPFWDNNRHCTYPTGACQ